MHKNLVCMTHLAPSDIRDLMTRIIALRENLETPSELPSLINGGRERPRRLDPISPIASGAGNASGRRSARLLAPVDRENDHAVPRRP